MWNLILKSELKIDMKMKCLFLPKNNSLLIFCFEFLNNITMRVIKTQLTLLMLILASNAQKEICVSLTTHYSENGYNFWRIQKKQQKDKDS